METTGKTIALEYQGRGLKLCNQRCRAWTHDYSYQGNGSTLSVAGCGIFSIVNASCWLTGVFQEPDELAQFSLDHGGRGERLPGGRVLQFAGRRGEGPRHPQLRPSGRRRRRSSGAGRCISICGRRRPSSTMCPRA